MVVVHLEKLYAPPHPLPKQASDGAARQASAIRRRLFIFWFVTDKIDVVCYRSLFYALNLVTVHAWPVHFWPQSIQMSSPK